MGQLYIMPAIIINVTVSLSKLTSQRGDSGMNNRAGINMLYLAIFLEKEEKDSKVLLAEVNKLGIKTFSDWS